MTDWRSNKRVSKNQIPNDTVKCALSDKCPCKKAPAGFCENPRMLKKDPQSLCHKMVNKNLLAILEIVPNPDQQAEPAQSA